MILRKLTLYIAVIVTFLCPAFSHAVTAAEVLKNVEKKLLTSQSVTISYSTKSQQGTLDGSLTVQGKKYTMSAGSLSIWFDGKTQWTLNSRSSELTVTLPTAEEQAESNPFSLLHDWTKAYNASLTAQNSTSFTITLTPKNKKESVKKAVLVVTKGTYHPKSMNVTMNNGSTALITVKAVSMGKALPTAHFTYDVKRVPKNIEVIDLR